MKIVKSLCLCLLMGGFLLPFLALAQEPTDRPFPAAKATATDRPFLVAATPTVESRGSADVTAVDAEATSELLLADLQATADAALVQVIQLEAEQERLVAELEASRTDNGATMFAVVIIVVGVLLGLAVFFGLRRSGE